MSNCIEEENFTTLNNYLGKCHVKFTFEKQNQIYEKWNFSFWHLLAKFTRQLLV